ncbi:MAG: hypothetical protein MJA27_25225 [Pseudanabaenales cyanobacterium]|nr:hypothetical protein [Pseudanabaenales cyanobacterium]
MFFSWCGGNPFCSPDSTSSKSYRKRQLDFLKWVKDSLETRLAAVNAAIESIENQLNRDEGEAT